VEPLLRGLVRRRTPGKGKGCDIGYALAASSCEGANSVDACTVTALDAITAFAVPNPNYSSQSRRFFQVWLLFGLPRRADHSAYFGLAKFYLSQPFQPSTEATLEICPKIVNAPFRCNRPVAMDQNPETQPIESLLLSEWQIKSFPFFHSYIHRGSKAWATRRSVWRDHVNILPPENTSGMVVTISLTQCPGDLGRRVPVPRKRVFVSFECALRGAVGT
jgi:hypothetical protein